MRITLKQLAVFITIANNNNMSQAAQTLHLTQSACSMALSTLENQLGVILFDRHGRQLMLNEQGRVLLPKAINILGQIEEFQNIAAAKEPQTLAGHLVIGASSTIGNYLLPKIIGHFIADYPQIKIIMQIANSDQIIAELLKFTVDVGFIEGNCYADELLATRWGKDELVIIASPDHVLSKKTKITLVDLHEAHWILREPGSGTRERFEQAIDGKIYPKLELGQTEAIKNAVREGLGISCLSRLTVAEELKNGQLITLATSLALERNFNLLLHKDKYQTAVLTAFIRYTTEAYKLFW